MKGHSRRRWLHLRSVVPILHLAGALPLLLGVLVASCQAATKAREEESVQVEVRQVGFDHVSNSPVVILQDKEHKKAMPIWIGPSEAQAIALELQGVPPARPFTHDLMKNILEQVGVEFEKVVVSELKGSTYYAHIYLTSAGKPFEVDSRPSDAIALALRFHRPIFIAKELFDTALPVGTPEGQPEPASVKVSGVTVQDLTAELAAYFNVPEVGGVLVADSGHETGEGHLQRGDIIIAVEGEVVRDVAEFRHKLSKEKGHLVTLRVLFFFKRLSDLLSMSEASPADVPYELFAQR
ncbi:MAG: bifunctional nuclease family protein [Deltaproteobacteria bacterium]|nr:bifunctional nuclease family protein [Deltaproteobacteria bacterium]